MLLKITFSDGSTWVLLVVPYQVVWDHYEEPFTQACLELLGTDINVSIFFYLVVNILNCIKKSKNCIRFPLALKHCIEFRYSVHFKFLR